MLEEYSYYLPTRVIAGSGCVRSHAGDVKAFGRKALVVTGRSSAKKCGALDDVASMLAENGQEMILFDKVMSNPTVACVFEGARLARSGKVDFIIAIGGGSPMDAAKAIALVATRDAVGPDTIFTTPITSSPVLPMVFIPTTAGTGSEVTQYSILTNDEGQTKTSLSSPVLFPRLAFLDSSYLAFVPHTTLINTAVDALSHSIEGMISVKATPISDALAVEGIRLIAACIPALRQGKLEKVDRERLMTASTLGGMVIAHTGTTIVHAMGYSLTYHHDIDHGRANGLLLGAFMNFTARQDDTVVGRILHTMGMEGVGDFSALMDELLGGKEKMEDSEFESYALKAVQTRNHGNCPVKPSVQDVVGMYRESFTC